MSSGFVRGPICGVDNCTSNLWKRIDGRNVCYYGHVNENDIEIDDEEDQLDKQTQGTFSRRLRNVAGLTDTQAKKLRSQQLLQEQQRDYAHGLELKKLLIQCLQIILMRQTEMLEAKLNLPHGYQNAVKRYWAMYLMKKHTKKHSSKLSSQMADFSSVPTVSDLLVFCYLGLVRMRVPVYFNDLWLMVSSGELPFLRAENVIPVDLRLRVPVHALRVFHGPAGQKVDHLIKIGRWVRELAIEQELAISFNWYPLLSKTVLRLRLPLEIIIMVSNIIRGSGLELRIAASKSSPNPEIAIWALIVVSATEYFAQNVLKYGIWREIYESRSASRDEMGVMQNQVSNKSGFLDLVGWSEKQTNEYLDFFESQLLPIVSKDNLVDDTNTKYHTQKIMTNRLFNIFDLPQIATNHMDPVSCVIADYKRYTEPLAKPTQFNRDFTKGIIKGEIRANYGIKESIVDKHVIWGMKQAKKAANHS
ncbi:hypothetical protein OGAPHI_001932 [Ogataea philodendri]|uniref:RRN7-type domain-containing protein n=1 Tax=Ogataea philodendri TaxID=1378263 RepID=A0A9P8T6J8_9ASCO|nr:uncharacterized protein OGAPHI_001932 [Ogataea philodendri]KAH3668178.1 hypothetical protein OGAPHI_001932 [Ogataea philodendri]